MLNYLVSVDMFRFMLGLAAFVSLIGCATPYQDHWVNGGVEASRLSKTTFRIFGRGNMFTDKKTIDDHIMLKAAETTRSAGATHFIVLEHLNASYAFTSETPAHTTTEDFLGTKHTTYHPASKERNYLPGKAIDIRLLSARKGRALPKRRALCG